MAKKELRLKDMKVGESVVGYVVKLFKAPKSLTPDIENLALVDKEGNEITIWSSGTLRYFRERMEKAGVSEGVLTKITRIEKPANTDPKSKQQFWCNIVFKKSDTKDPSTLNVSSGGGTDADGFSEF